MQTEFQIPLMNRCAREIGLTVSEVLGIEATAPRRYKTYTIPKRSGGMRLICQPARELKAIQYVFLRKLLVDAPIHPAATAYRRGTSIRENALPHCRSRVILKLDFEDFFHSITVDYWIKYTIKQFPFWSERDIEFSSNILFWGEGGYSPRCLSIGAPTSPLISNIMMFDFDSMIQEFSDELGLTYTRYADDLTFSSNIFLDVDVVKKTVETSIKHSLLSNLRINSKKTYLASKARARRVTGLVLTNDGRVSLGRDRKRLISVMVDHAKKGTLPDDELSTLGGLLSFAFGIEPAFLKILERKYGLQIIDHLMNRVDI